MSTPEFVCSQTPWLIWYLPAEAEQSKSTSTICETCGGRRLQPFNRHTTWWCLDTYGPHTRLEVNRGYVRWKRNHCEPWGLYRTMVNGSGFGTMRVSRKTPSGELDPRWFWSEDYDESCIDDRGPEENAFPWDWDFGQAARGVKLLDAEDAELVDLYAKGVLRTPLISEWGASLEDEPKMSDIEGSYIVKFRPLRRTGRRKTKAPPNLDSIKDGLMSQVEDGVEVDAVSIVTDLTDDSFELISNTDSWCLTDAE